MLRVFASFFSCQRASALGTAQSVPRPAERSKTFEPKTKNPASSAGPIRPPQANGFARCSTQDYPLFVTGLTSSPERARFKLDIPSLSALAGQGGSIAFSQTASRVLSGALNFA